MCREIDVLVRFFGWAPDSVETRPADCIAPMSRPARTAGRRNRAFFPLPSSLRHTICSMITILILNGALKSLSKPLL